MKIFSLFFILILSTSCQLFQRKAAIGPNYYETRWEQAAILLKEQKYDEAEPVLKELYLAGQSASPELSTRALFELGQLSEKKGEWLQALAQFKECESKRSNLPGYKAELELPARLAGLYATLGELQLSENYAKKVESNLQAYMQQISLDQQKAWWAETFFRMGSFPIQNINAENWKEFALRFHSTSQYLIRSMELSDPIWSKRSLELAQMFFKKSFEFLVIAHNDLEENKVLLGSIVRERISLLQDILQKIELYRPPSLESSRAAWLFYESSQDYKSYLQNKLYEIRDSVPVSQESQKRNAIERQGTLIDPPGSSIDKNLNDPNM
jgi:hypothetical protein